MAKRDSKKVAERRLIETFTGTLEIFVAGSIAPGEPLVCAAHPGGVFAESAADLLRETAETSAVCINPRGIGASSPLPAGDRSYTLELMVDDLDAVRRHLGVESWLFWGMSGGGWLGLAYACKYPDALESLILESICSCFRTRLADPECILSPFHSSWRSALEKEGLIDRYSHLAVGDAGATEWLEVENVGSVFRRCNGPALLVSPMPVAPEMRAAMPLLWTIDFRNSLPDIRMPTLVIGGSADPIVPLPHVRSLHEAIPGSRFLIVEGAGHVPTTARRREVADTVRAFLRNRGR